MSCCCCLQVRIQKDRGHKVCDTGPYAYVRHPAYIAVVIQSLAEAVLLQSSWLLWIGIVRSAVLATRTAAEDALLQQQLPGYAEYAGRVKYRWLPLVY
jgi:protein-S-isoprenylcysteine O-methyltransferase Ste14